VLFVAVFVVAIPKPYLVLDAFANLRL